MKELKKLKATGIILAGGKNSRIGTEKAFLEAQEGQLLIDNILYHFRRIFPDIIIVTNNPKAYLKFKVKVAEDLIKDKGPLGGIFSGLCFSNNELNFVVACDMPFINSDLIRYILKKPKEYDVVVPKIRGKAESLFARYSKTALPTIFSNLMKSQLKIQEVLKKLNVLKIDLEEIERFDPEGLSFFNINTKEDFEKARTLFLERLQLL